MSDISIVEGKFLKAGAEVLDARQPGDLGKIAAVLSAPDAVWSLANKGQAAAVIEVVKVMNPEQQMAVLSAPNAGWGLANHGQAGGMVHLVMFMKPEQQVAVLSAPDAVRGLAYNGYARYVAQHAKVMEPEQQVAILSAPFAMSALVNNGQARAALELVNAMKPQQQAAVLSAPDAVWDLVFHESKLLPTPFREISGILAQPTRAAGVVELLKAMEPEQQAAVLSMSTAVHALVHGGQAAAVEEIKRSSHRLAEKAPAQQAAHAHSDKPETTPAPEAPGQKRQHHQSTGPKLGLKL